MFWILVMKEEHEMHLGASSNRNLGAASEDVRSSRSSRNTSLFRPGEHNMTEAQIKEVTDQLRQDVIAHLWRHRWMKKVVFATIIFFAIWIFTIVTSVIFLGWWIKVDSGASKSFKTHFRQFNFELFFTKLKQKYSVLPTGAVIAWVPTDDTPLPRGWLPCDGTRFVKEGPWQGKKTHNLAIPNTFGVFGSNQNCVREDPNVPDDQTRNCRHGWIFFLFNLDFI